MEHYKKGLFFFFPDDFGVKEPRRPSENDFSPKKMYTSIVARVSRSPNITSGR